MSESYAQSNIHSSPAQNTATSKYLKLVVSVENPYSILATEAGLDNVLGHCTNDLRFRTIQVFEGPATDQSLFRVAIHKTIVREESRYQLVLYDLYGRPHNKLVSFAPYHNAPGVSAACMITIEKSDAVLLSSSFPDSACAQALVTAEWPHQIRMVNSELSRALACDPSHLLGRPASALHGPATDVLRWCTLLQSACDGQADAALITLATRAGAPVRAQCRCVPVVEEMNGKILYALLQLHPAPADDAAAPAPPAQAPPASPPSHDLQRRAASAGGEREGVCSPTAPARAPGAARRTPHVKIHPRRKASDPATAHLPTLPVTVTLELLDELAEHTLLRAADVLGVSATALKIACRKLGVRKWHYRRRSDGDSPATPAPGAAPATPTIPAAPASWPAIGGGGYSAAAGGAGYPLSRSCSGDDAIDDDGAAAEPDSPAYPGSPCGDGASWHGAGDAAVCAQRPRCGAPRPEGGGAAAAAWAAACAASALAAARPEIEVPTTLNDPWARPAAHAAPEEQQQLHHQQQQYAQHYHHRQQAQEQEQEPQADPTLQHQHCQQHPYPQALQAPAQCAAGRFGSGTMEGLDSDWFFGPEHELARNYAGDFL